MERDFLCAYSTAKEERKKNNSLRIEQNNNNSLPRLLLKRLFLSKKYNNNLIAKLAGGELTALQLKQIKKAITSGLSDKQINSLVESKKDAATMSAIIDIAIALNEKEGV